MKNWLVQPHKIYWILMWLCLLLALMTSNQTLDIQLHDTYFVITSFHIGLGLAVLWGLWGLGYYLVGYEHLWKWAIWVHLIVGIVLLLGFWGYQLSVEPAYVNVTNFGAHQKRQSFMGLGILIVGLSQILYLVNISVGVWKRLR